MWPGGCRALGGGVVPLESRAWCLWDIGLWEAGMRLVGNRAMEERVVPVRYSALGERPVPVGFGRAGWCLWDIRRWMTGAVSVGLDMG